MTMPGCNAIHKQRTTLQYLCKYLFCSKKMPSNSLLAFHWQCEMYLFVVIFIELIATNTCDAARNALQPTTNVLNMNGMHSNGSTADSYVHLADGKTLKRDKRFLLFTNGGISKIVLGFLTPVETRDHVNWRTMNLAYNFQAQYVPIPSVIFLWDRFARSLVDQRRRYDADSIFGKDLTRTLVYAALEMFLDRQGKPGRKCLLKAICEAAEHPIAQNSIFDEIVHLVLTPNEDETDIDYVQAKHAGEFATDCTHLYRDCQPGDGLLDNISKFM